MPDRHRHDEFIGALIFSLIINLLIVFALVMPRPGKKTARAQAFIVTIEARRPVFPRPPPTKVRALAVPTPASPIKRGEPRPYLSKRATIDPALPPPENAAVAVIRPVAPSAPERKGEDLPPPTAESAIATSAPADGTALAVKNDAGGNYTAPQRITGADPPYPKEAERRGWEGRVLLTLWINADGEVERVEIVETSGYDLLDRSACNAVSTWRFEPARRNGIAVAETVHLPIIYRRTFSGKKR